MTAELVTETLYEMDFSYDGRGVEIKLKSPIIEDFFKAYCEGAKDAGAGSVWQQPFYIMPPQHKEDTRYSLKAWGNNRLFTDANLVNMSFLRAVGLAEGKTILIKGTFFPDEVERFKTQLIAALDAFYDQRIRKEVVRITTTIEKLFVG